MTLPAKLKTQPRWKAVYIRIDTLAGRPLLQTRPCLEIVLTFILNFRQQGWFELLGFLVMPKEIQLIVVPKDLTVNALVGRLESETGPLLAALLNSPQPIFDTEIYSEPLDGVEAIKSRLQMMHAAPVRARLAPIASAYDYSSANPRFAKDLSS